MVKQLGSRLKEQINMGEIKEKVVITERAMVVEGTPRGAPINTEVVISKEEHPN